MAEFCTNCGTQIDESTRFCPGYGAAVAAPAPA
ncbi:MAG: zinc-ribbon domain-containing protein [Clostridia bacterium]|nr:zinc-ribbon domain-containing protein [Clostridia bacterium]